jgi:hypothetical protein
MFCDHPFLINTHSDYKDFSQLEKTVRNFIEKRYQASLANNEISHYEILMEENESQEERIELKTMDKPSEAYLKEVLYEIKNNS